MLSKFKLYIRDIFNFSYFFKIDKKLFFNPEYVFDNKYKKFIYHYLTGISIVQKYGLKREIRLHRVIECFPNRMWEISLELDWGMHEHYTYIYNIYKESDLHTRDKYGDNPHCIDFIRKNSRLSLDFKFWPKFQQRLKNNPIVERYLKNMYS